MAAAHPLVLCNWHSENALSAPNCTSHPGSGIPGIGMASGAGDHKPVAAKVVAT